MIAPEVLRPGNGQTSRLILLRNNLLASSLIFALLQCWRPYFFLTDDNLDGGLPFFTEMGRHLLAGKSPFFSDYIFGGHYNLLRDPISFAWHPLYFLVSLLAATPFRFAIIDVDAFVLLLLATAGFVNLAWYLRREMSLTISDGWLMFYTLSFTYSMYVLSTGASWLDFLGNQSSLPWLALGILQRSGWRGILLVALFSLHQLLGGHQAPTLTSSIFLTLFAMGISLVQRSYVPLASWVIGYSLAVIFIMPLLFPAMSGFLSSVRGAYGVTLSDMQANNIPLTLFPTSLFLGTAIWIIHPSTVALTTTYTLAMGSCAAAWCLISALAGRTKVTRFEWVIIGLLLVIMLMVVRPTWLANIMMHLPLLRSTRWPFRELMQFQFFFHLFLLVRQPGFTRPRRRFIAGLSLLAFVPPLLLHAPPTLNPMFVDRHLLFSGSFDRFWAGVRPLLRPGDRVASILPVNTFLKEDESIPYSLIGTFNWASLARVRNIWGWSQTPPRDQYDVDVLPLFVFGAYQPSQAAEIAKVRPPVRLISLVTLHPLKITLSSANGGPPIDLTPLIPPEAHLR